MASPPSQEMCALHFKHVESVRSPSLVVKEESTVIVHPSSAQGCGQESARRTRDCARGRALSSDIARRR